MKYEAYTLVGGTWRSRGEVNAASAEQAARIFSLRSGHRLVRVKPEGRLGEYKVFDFTRKSNPMSRKRRKIKRNPRRTRRVKTWAKRVKRHRRKHNTVDRGFYTPAGRAVYGYLKRKRKNPSESGWIRMEWNKNTKKFYPLVDEWKIARQISKDAGLQSTGVKENEIDAFIMAASKYGLGVETVGMEY